MIRWAIGGVIGLGTIAIGTFAVSRATQSVPAPSPVRQIAVTADERTIYGKGWDGAELGAGIPGLPGFGMFSTVSPPDIVLCIVDLEGAACQFKDDEKGQPQSLFHDRFTAQFPVELDTSKPFGIIAYDIDGALPLGLDPDDLVDAAIIAEAGMGTSEIETAMRELIEQVAPSAWVFRKGEAGERRFSLSDNERKRREGPLPVFNIEGCRGDGCRLQQAQIQFS